MIFHNRKSPRIPKYDYSLPNSYFITICTHEKKCIFGKPNMLNVSGKIAEECIIKIAEIYPHAFVENYVVMPNHIHMILRIENEKSEKTLPSVTQIVGQYKMSVTKKIRRQNYNEQIWQRSFHDHIIRNQRSLEIIWEYINNNPMKWEEDCFYK